MAQREERHEGRRAGAPEKGVREKGVERREREEREERVGEEGEQGGRETGAGSGMNAQGLSELDSNSVQGGRRLQT